MKNFSFSFLLILLYNTCLAQQNTKSFTLNKDGKPRLYSVSNINMISNVQLCVDASTVTIESSNIPPNQPLTNLVFLEGTKTVQLYCSLHPDSLSYYRYSITENDERFLVTNATPDKIVFKYPRQNGQAGLSMVNLGIFPIENKKLRLEIYKITQNYKVNTVILYNKPIRPAGIHLTSLHKKLPGGHTGVEMKNLAQNVSVQLNDTIKGLLFSIENTDINFVYQVYLKYIASGKKIKIGNNWLYDFIYGHPYQWISAAYLQNPGEYELQVVPVLSAGPKAKMLTQKSTVFRFIVQKEASFSKNEIGLIMASFLMVSGLCLAFVKLQGNKKLAKEQQQKEMSQLQLNLVRAQLNPHFMFNALASIQNLMNKQDTDNANHYLGKFARLTRHVLKNQEFVSLEDEISLLEDYLQMEKMRFGFQYSISVAETLDIANVEIPTMLLQPFVENAVKHGLSGLQDKGKISISFEEKEKDLLLLVRDNGTGFDPTIKIAGLGLELSHSRIALLNKIYKNTPILLHIESDSSGTEVRISLLNWL